MSIALERSNSGGGDQRIERQGGFAHRNMGRPSSIHDPTDFVQGFRIAQQLASDGSLSSTSSSSIGNNSDDGDGGGDGEEVQSDYKGGPLDSLDALEDVLPIKKSISKFYCGKSKSFTSLSDAATCSSINDITKPENAYTKKRKNLLAFNNFLDKNHNSIPRSSNGGTSKRPTNSRSMLSLAAMMSCSESNSEESYSSNSSSPGCCLPPLPPHARRVVHREVSVLPPADKFSSGRSFSLSDLQGAAAAAVSTTIVDHGAITATNITLI